MKRSEVTYGQLDQTLRALGFTCRPSRTSPQGRVYEHKSGALILLPEYPDSEKVFEYHMLTVQGDLENFGIADASTFAARLKKAG